MFYIILIVLIIVLSVVIFVTKPPMDLKSIGLNFIGNEIPSFFQNPCIIT